MSRFHSYLSSASNVIDSYKGEVPFVQFIKKYFAANKKMGSRDRKTISNLCYSYFRTRHALPPENTAQRIIKGLFLCETKSHPLLKELYPDFDEKIALSVNEKCKELKIDSSGIFPFAALLSDKIDIEAHNVSFLTQPLLFLRIRPGKQQKVLAKLNEAGLVFKNHGQDCLALLNTTSVKEVLKINKDAVVQDYNSQKVFDLPLDLLAYFSSENNIAVWDCCAASGGKSILLYDKMEGKIKLTVSDIRKTILVNLQQRLQEAAIPVYKTFEADLVKAVPAESEKFELIICDVPCTGSGTWSRSPEQLAYFKAPAVKTFNDKQKKIAASAATLLKNGGLFYYITCSVFKKENEEVVSFLQQENGLKLLHMTYLHGYQMQADTMFVAVLTK